MSHLSGKSLILCDVNALSIIFISVGAFLIFRGFEKMCDVNTLLNKKITSYHFRPHFVPSGIAFFDDVHFSA